MILNLKTKSGVCACVAHPWKSDFVFRANIFGSFGTSAITKIHFYRDKRWALLGVLTVDPPWVSKGCVSKSFQNPPQTPRGFADHCRGFTRDLLSIKSGHILHFVLDSDHVVAFVCCSKLQTKHNVSLLDIHVLIWEQQSLVWVVTQYVYKIKLAAGILPTY